MRLLICECAPNFIGDATVACIPVDKKIEHICQSDSECTPNTACINQRCINPCGVSPCAHSAECHVENHRHRCLCHEGLIGDPFINCHKDALPECTINSDCISDLACINRVCQNPCLTTRCGSNSECVVHNHHPTCRCPINLAGDPQVQCFNRT